VVFLPSYSPDCNLIAHAVAKSTGLAAPGGALWAAIVAAVGQVVDTITFVPSRSLPPPG
jgi:hypothetical protein